MDDLSLYCQRSSDVFLLILESKATSTLTTEDTKTPISRQILIERLEEKLSIKRSQNDRFCKKIDKKQIKKVNYSRLTRNNNSFDAIDQKKFVWNIKLEFEPFLFELEKLSEY